MILQTPAFFPNRLPNLDLDLDFTLGVTLSGSNITNIKNQSPAGSTNDFAQATGADQPTTSAGLISGFAAAVFGSSLRLQNSGNIPSSGSTSRTIYVVCRPSSAQGGGLYATRTTFLSSDLLLLTLGGVQYLWSNDSVNASRSTPVSYANTNIVYEHTSVNGSPVAVSINGASITMTTPQNATTDNGTAGTWVGNRPSSSTSQYFIGGITRVLVYSRLLSTIERADVTRYLRNRYSI